MDPTIRERLHSSPSESTHLVAPESIKQMSAIIYADETRESGQAGLLSELHLIDPRHKTIIYVREFKGAT
jgi:hypothetical protein